MMRTQKDDDEHSSHELTDRHTSLCALRLWGPVAHIHSSQQGDAGLDAPPLDGPEAADTHGFCKSRDPRFRLRAVCDRATKPS